MKTHHPLAQVGSNIQYSVPNQEGLSYTMHWPINREKSEGCWESWFSYSCLLIYFRKHVSKCSGQTMSLEPGPHNLLSSCKKGTNVRIQSFLVQIKISYHIHEIFEVMSQPLRWFHPFIEMRLQYSGVLVTIVSPFFDLNTRDRNNVQSRWQQRSYVCIPTPEKAHSVERCQKRIKWLNITNKH